MRRFVVQEHRVRAGDVHYDLMLEDGEVLVTFQLDAPPGPHGPARGRRSFDHRPVYLDYEGPISGDRGEVRIWDRGRMSDLEGDPRAPRYRARAAGERLRGVVEVRDQAGQVEVLVEAPG